MDFQNALNRLRLSPGRLRVWVFAPYLHTEEGLFSEHYAKPVTQSELAAAFDALGVEWQWQPVTLENAGEVVRAVTSSNGPQFPLVLNYCDGDDINGYPGLSVLRRLEEAGVPFTGADSAFYGLTTSKIPMKEAFLRTGVPTSPFAVIEQGADLRGICARLGPPLLVKPAVSAGSYGLSLRSVVQTDADLALQVNRLLHQNNGWDMATGGVFVERFIAGPEYTVLVVGSSSNGLRIYPPLERVFNPILPEEERFFSFDRYWEIYREEKPLPPGEHLYRVRLAAPELWDRLGDVSRQAYLAVGGTGYARVDLRMDSRTGEIFVLEVNSNPGVSSPADDSSVGRILEQSDLPFHELIGEILADGLLRFFSRQSPVGRRADGQTVDGQSPVDGQLPTED